MNILKILTKTVLLWAFIWFCGCLAFFGHILTAQRAPLCEKSDAIVVFTGAPGRVDMGVALLRAGLAPRLFISGVNPAADKKAILGKTNEDLAQQVTLGQGAGTTQQNAQEVATWLRGQRYPLHTLRLVTSTYHMPRARLEMISVIPGDIEIIVHPISDPRFDTFGWPLIRLVMEEYNKMLVRWVQTLPVRWGSIEQKSIPSVP